MTKTRSRILFSGLLAITIALPLTFVVHPGIRGWLIENAQTYGYIGMFVLAFLGGTTTLVPIPYFIVVIALAGIGFNPYLLGLSAGLGATAGDTVSYFVGYHGQTFFSTGAQKKFNRIHRVLTRWPALTPVFLFLFGAVVPLPDDLVILPLGLVRHRYVSTVVPVGLGKIVMNTNLALGGGFFFFHE